MRVTAMRGLPGSGKSTEARKIAEQTSAVIVSRDDLRYQTFGRFTDVDEEVITKLEEAKVKALLESGTSVVIDAMHLNPKYLKKWAGMASQFGADWDIYDVLTEVEDCIVQDADDDRVSMGKRVGPTFILKQAKRWPMHKWPAVEAPDSLTMVPYEPPEGKPFAIIVDIDGTLAHVGNVDGKPARSHYDYTKVSTDDVDPCVRDIVRKYAETGVEVLVMSGREDSCREDTMTWLTDNGIPWSGLYMRKAKDYRNDTIIKYELFDAHVRNDYRVLFCLDDRDRVVRMWRELGLKCLQVAEGQF